MLIMLNVIKTKSTNVNRVKYIFYSKNYKTNENKNIFIWFPKLEGCFSMTNVLSGFGIDAIFFGRSGTRGFSRYSFFSTHSTVSFTILCK